MDCAEPQDFCRRAAIFSALLHVHRPLAVLGAQAADHGHVGSHVEIALAQGIVKACQGRVQILAVPADTIGEAVVVMTELSRLKSLDPDADWSNFAVLAHNRATLDPIRAWCQQNKVPYRLSDRQSAGPKLHQTREACCLLDLLRNRPARRLRPGCLTRWFALRFAGNAHENPWLTLLG